MEAIRALNHAAAALAREEGSPVLERAGAVQGGSVPPAARACHLSYWRGKAFVQIALGRRAADRRAWLRRALDAFLHARECPPYPLTADAATKEAAQLVRALSPKEADGAGGGAV